MIVHKAWAVYQGKARWEIKTRCGIDTANYSKVWKPVTCPRCIEQKKIRLDYESRRSLRSISSPTTV